MRRAKGSRPWRVVAVALVGGGIGLYVLGEALLRFTGTNVHTVTRSDRPPAER